MRSIKCVIIWNKSYIRILSGSQPVLQSFSQSASNSISHPVFYTVRHSVSQQFSQPVSHSSIQ